jgi:hypothetical protein
VIAAGGEGPAHGYCVRTVVAEKFIASEMRVPVPV